MIAYWLLAILTYGAALGAVAAFALALLRRWSPAHKLARLTTLIALGVFSLSVIALGLLFVVPTLGVVVFRAL
jgi:hypothetical protein